MYVENCGHHLRLGKCWVNIAKLSLTHATRQEFTTPFSKHYSLLFQYNYWWAHYDQEMYKLSREGLISISFCQLCTYPYWQVEAKGRTQMRARSYGHVHTWYVDSGLTSFFSTVTGSRGSLFSNYMRIYIKIPMQLRWHKTWINIADHRHETVEIIDYLSSFTPLRRVQTFVRHILLADTSNKAFHSWIDIAIESSLWYII